MLSRFLSFTLVLVCGMISAPAALRLTEVVTNNVSSLVDEDNDSPDWIELHNDGDESASLAGYFLTDDQNDLNQWEFPDVSLDPGAYIVVFASGKDRRVAAGNLHTNFQLKNGGEYLALVDPDKTTVIDAFDPEIPQLEDDQSYGVRASGGTWVLHYFNTPTPGAENASGTVAEEVQFSVRGQPFTDTVEVVLSTRSGSRITYTMDGKKPTLFNGQTYSEPIVLEETTILSASISRGPLTQEVFFKVTPELAARTSNLPLVMVQSDGRVANADYKDMLLGILEPSGDDSRTKVEGPFTLNSKGQIRGRGSSTLGFPKKSYRLEFQDEDGEDKVVKPLGMPSESDWILSGRYEEDRSLIRNEFTYALSRQVGRYAARTRFCEVYFAPDGDDPVSVDDYIGVYSFMESLKRDADRIDIDELLPEHAAEPEITGGYIFKVDRAGDNDTVTTAGGQSIAITEPARTELTSEQLAYLRGYLGDMADSFDSSDPETGYPAYIDVGSWLDHHLINTLMLNVDSLRLSTYFYKQRLGKVFAGPVWDFNISSGSRDRFGSPPRPSEPEVWRGISGDRGTTFFTNGTQRWWGDLFQQRDFQQAYCDRWHELRQGAFSTENIHALIDRMADEIREAQQRNEARWPQVPPEYGGWQGEIDHLKDWLATRAAWMDGELVKPPTAIPDSGALTEGETVQLQGRRGTLLAPTTLYYTTDGTDPRLPGGEINPSAIEYPSEGILLETSATIVAREYLPDYNPKPDGPDQQWSAPASFAFIVGVEPAAAGNLVVSEIMYHPSNPSESEIAAGFTNDDAFEYLELANIGTSPIDLLGVSATDGIAFHFTDSHILAPGETALLVSNEAAFHERYGAEIEVAGVYAGNLRNSGESLALVSASGEAILAFGYDDNDPWPDEADGDGVSLVLNDPNSNPDPNMVGSWTVGTPSPGRLGGGEPAGQSYEAWAAVAIPEDRASDPLDDPDADGLVNLLEYALNRNPILAETEAVLVLRGSPDSTTVHYEPNANAPDAALTVEMSNDLVQWNALPAGTPSAEGITVTLPRGSTGFVRLRVE